MELTTMPKTIVSQAVPSKPTNPASSRTTIGWREWLALPDLGVGCLKGKIDTSRRASRLHATHLHTVSIDGEKIVRFRIYPIAQDPRTSLEAEAPVVDEHFLATSRSLAAADGRLELCPVIRTRLTLGRVSWLQDLLLVDQSAEAYRLILGRHALSDRFVVDPSRSFVGGPPVLIHS